MAVDPDWAAVFIEHANQKTIDARDRMREKRQALAEAAEDWHRHLPPQGSATNEMLVTTIKAMQEANDAELAFALSMVAEYLSGSNPKHGSVDSRIAALEERVRKLEAGG